MTGVIIVILFLALLACVGIVLTSLQVMLTWGLMRIHIPAPADKRRVEEEAAEQPRVSILKPICGLEDGLEENLASFASLRGISYEVILSVESLSDPALAVIEKVRRRFPDAPFSLTVGPLSLGEVSNPKVERLVAAARMAQGSILFVSDSNVRVSPDDLAKTVALFDDPNIGCVSNLFVAEGAATFGAMIESLYILTFVAAGNVLADAAEVACVVGKSMAITREVHDRIGGFEAFANRLAEDQAIALAVIEAGYQLALSPVVVRNVIVRKKLRAAMNRQIRWGKIRYAFSKATYTSEFLVNPFPLTVLACAVAAFFAPQPLPFLAGFSVATLLIRLLQTRALAKLTGAGLSWAQIILMPAQDVLQFAMQFVPYVSNEVNWRNHWARLGPGTLMLPSHLDMRPAPAVPLEVKPLQ